MKVEKITVDLLKKHNACEKGVRFFEINRLEGFPVELIGEVKGDYNGFVDWVKGIIDIHIRINQEYDENGHLVWKIQSDDATIEYRWDEMGNLVSVKDSCYINQYEYRYDDKGNKIWERDIDGNISQYEYDKKGNVICKKDIDIDEWKCQYRYDSNGNLIWKKDSNGDVFKWRYDERGNLIWCRDSNGNEWEYRYDESGNVIWIKGFDGKEYNYEVEYYDDGQLKKYGNLIIPWFEKN